MTQFILRKLAKGIPVNANLRGRITVQLTSCLFYLGSAALLKLKEYRFYLFGQILTSQTVILSPLPSVLWEYLRHRQIGVSIPRLLAPYCHLLAKINAMGTFFSTRHLSLWMSLPILLPQTQESVSILLNLHYYFAQCCAKPFFDD